MSTLYTRMSTLYTRMPTLHTKISTLYTRCLHCKDVYTVHKDVYTVHKDVYTVHKDAYTVHKDVYTVHKVDAAGTHGYLPSPKHPPAVTTMPVSTLYTRMSTQCSRRTKKPAQLSRYTADGSATP
jgi:hypothetical protein